MRPATIKLLLTIVSFTLLGSSFIPTTQLKVKPRTLHMLGNDVAAKPVKGTAATQEFGFALSSNTYKKKSENNEVFFPDLNRTYAQVWRGSHHLEFHNGANRDKK